MSENLHQIIYHWHLDKRFITVKLWQLTFHPVTASSDTVITWCSLRNKAFNTSYKTTRKVCYWLMLFSASVLSDQVFSSSVLTDVWLRNRLGNSILHWPSCWTQQ